MCLPAKQPFELLPDQFHLHLRYRAGRVEVLGTNHLAIEYGMAAEKPLAIADKRQPFLISRITAVVIKSGGLKNGMRPKIFRISPRHRTGTITGAAKYAIYSAIYFLAVLR